jgi:hypothetical protein
MGMAPTPETLAQLGQGQQDEFMISSTARRQRIPEQNEARHGTALAVHFARLYGHAIVVRVLANNNRLVFGTGVKMMTASRWCRGTNSL